MNEEQVSAGRRRRSRQEVDQLVAEYESSGLGREEFCRERGVGVSTLDRYRTRRKRQAPVGNALMAVEVSAPALAPIAGAGSVLAVVLRGGRRIEVGLGCDTSSLRQLVRVLEGV